MPAEKLRVLKVGEEGVEVKKEGSRCLQGTLFTPSWCLRARPLEAPAQGSAAEKTSPQPHTPSLPAPTGPPWPRQHSWGEEVRREVSKGVAAGAGDTPGKGPSLLPEVLPPASVWSS